MIEMSINYAYFENAPNTIIFIVGMLALAYLLWNFLGAAGYSYLLLPLTGAFVALSYNGYSQLAFYNQRLHLFEGMVGQVLAMVTFVLFLQCQTGFLDFITESPSSWRY